MQTIELMSIFSNKAVQFFVNMEVNCSRVTKSSWVNDIIQPFVSNFNVFVRKNGKIISLVYSLQTLAKNLEMVDFNLH